MLFISLYRKYLLYSLLHSHSLQAEGNSSSFCLDFPCDLFLLLPPRGISVCLRASCRAVVGQIPGITYRHDDAHQFYTRGILTAASHVAMRLKRTHSTGRRGVDAGNVQQRASRCAIRDLHQLLLAELACAGGPDDLDGMCMLIDRGAHGDCDVLTAGRVGGVLGLLAVWMEVKTPVSAGLLEGGGQWPGSPRSHRLPGLADSSAGVRCCAVTRCWPLAAGRWQQGRPAPVLHDV